MAAVSSRSAIGGRTRRAHLRLDLGLEEECLARLVRLAHPAGRGEAAAVRLQLEELALAVLVQGTVEREQQVVLDAGVGQPSIRATTIRH